GCQIPVGIYAAVDGEKISARAVIASIDGKNFVKDFATDTLKNIDDFGKNFAEKLLSSGGAKILLPTPLSLLPKQEVINFAYKNSQ
ncbi:MAG: hypothetical protein IJS81_04180, partial [Selenomonadaceae bacterium]|nr:hypothetical protein [Selenomonadaceae bacterium]